VSAVCCVCFVLCLLCVLPPVSAVAVVGVRKCNFLLESQKKQKVNLFLSTLRASHVFGVILSNFSSGPSD